MSFYRDFTASLPSPDIWKSLFPEKEAELAYMKAYISQIYGFYGYGLWSVLLKEEGRVIGRAGLSVREGYEFPELGFVIEAAYQKRATDLRSALPYWNMQEGSLPLTGYRRW